MNEVIKVLIVDDHAKIHRAISALIGILDDLLLVAQASNGEEAIQLCEEHMPDVILMDAIMPGMDGVQATRIITERFPSVKVLALSSFQDEEVIRDMMNAGAVGYLLKNSSINDLAQIIRTAHSGQAVFSPEVTQVMLNPSKSNPVPAKSFGLTPREFDVLRLLVEGKTNPDIAEELTISFSTVKFHVSSILSKLQVSSRVEAVAIAIENNLVT